MRHVGVLFRVAATLPVDEEPKPGEHDGELCEERRGHRHDRPKVTFRLQKVTLEHDDWDASVLHPGFYGNSDRASRSAPQNDGEDEGDTVTEQRKKNGRHDHLRNRSHDDIHIDVHIGAERENIQDEDTGEGASNLGDKVGHFGQEFLDE